MALQDRLADVPVLGTALAVQRRYQADAADPLAASIGFFGFLSLFPLLLLAVSAAGFVLQDPADQVAVVESLTAAIPGFDATLQDGEDSTEVAALVEGVVAQRGTIGLVGAVTLLLTGLKVVNGAMVATRVVFRGGLLKGVGVKLRQLAALVGLGLLALLGAAGSSLAAIGGGVMPEPLAVVLSLVVTFGFDLLLFLGAYVLLSPTSTMSARQLLPGAVLGAVGWSVLKVAGATYVGRQVDSANALYGALGGVVALLLLLYLAGRLYLYGAELAAVRVERRDGPLLPPTAGLADDDAEVAGTGGLDVTARNDDDREREPARPVDPGPWVAAPTVGVATRARLEAADRDRAQAAAARDAGSDARSAVAIGLGVAALVAAWRFLGPARQ